MSFLKRKSDNFWHLGPKRGEEGPAADPPNSSDRGGRRVKMDVGPHNYGQFLTLSGVQYVHARW